MSNVACYGPGNHVYYGVSMIELFFSYSHRDEDMRDELECHLAALRREGVIAPWHDRRILAGDEFDGTIATHLETAGIVLLLVSPYFLASDYCSDVEVATAIARHEAGTARVIPVILHPCDWKRTPFGKLLAVPTDGKPISKHANLHDAFLDIVTGIRRAAEQLERAGQVSHAATTEPSRRAVPAVSKPRSSNLRIARQFSDHERSQFRDATFEYIANYFENSLAELCSRHTELAQNCRRVDANTFTAAVYLNGSERSACSITMNSQFGDIAYGYGYRHQHNSCNEWFSIEHDGHVPTLRAGGMAVRSQSDSNMTQEGAAEYLWSMFIEPLQSQR